MNNFIQFPNWLLAMQEFSNKKPVNRFLVNVSRYLDLRPRLLYLKLETLNRRLQIGSPKIGHVHVPKTGGTYTNGLNLTLPHVNFSHIVCRTNRSDNFCPIGLSPISKRKLNGYYLFANVRNPITFLISYYHHVIGFQDYVNVHHYDYRIAQVGFDSLVNSILNRDNIWPSRKFLFPMLFDQEGQLIVDWINRNECLDEDLEKLALKFDCAFIQQKKARSAPKKSGNPLDYYSDETLKRVIDNYSREMKLFGYTANELSKPLISLPEIDKTSIRYEYLSDSLYLNETLINR